MAIGQPTVRPVKTPSAAPDAASVNPAAQSSAQLPPSAPSASPPPMRQDRPRDREVHTITELPSGFKGYGGVDYIEICAFTLGELKYLASGLTELQVIDAFKNKIRNINIMELSVFDFWFIGSFVNVMTSKIMEWTMDVTCGSCGEVFNHKTSRDGMFTFDDLNIPELPVVVTLGGTEFKFDIPRVKDIYTAKELQKRFPNSSEELITLACQARIAMLPSAALQILENLTDIDDIALVNKLQSLFYHGSAPLTAKCPKCGFEGKYWVGSGVSMIKPFREDGGSFDARITFGAGHGSE